MLHDNRRRWTISQGTTSAERRFGWAGMSDHERDDRCGFRIVRDERPRFLRAIWSRGKLRSDGRVPAYIHASTCPHRQDGARDPGSADSRVVAARAASTTSDQRKTCFRDSHRGRRNRSDLRGWRVKAPGRCLEGDPDGVGKPHREVAALAGGQPPQAGYDRYA